MKVFLDPPQVASRSLGRVAEALWRYGGEGIETVRYASQAELVVFHVIGRYDQVLEAAHKLKRRGARYAVVQYCVKSTQRPDSRDWLSLWEEAALVWSYYDLPDMLAEDGATSFDFNFMHAPLGVDTAYFTRPNGYFSFRNDLVVTSGQSRLTESVRECVLAARHHKGTVAHLGPELNYGFDVRCYQNLDDEQVAEVYQNAEYVSGLRRIEGFELPAAEGLLCGARPVLFDRPHYRQWFTPWAYFIPEGDRETVLESLKLVFEDKAKPVSDQEWEDAAALFNWPRVVGEFWRQLR